MVAMPVPAPVTTPVDDTVATAVLALLQVQPGVADANDAVVPMHIVAVPVIAAGVNTTVIALVT